MRRRNCPSKISNLSKTLKTDELIFKSLCLEICQEAKFDLLFDIINKKWGRKSRKKKVHWNNCLREQLFFGQKFAKNFKSK